MAEEGRFLNVEPETLDSHVRFFLRRGRRFLRVEDLVASWPRNAVVFTFDDAYLSAMTNGLDVLLRHQAPATFYAVPAHVGGTSAWDQERERSLAGWELLKKAHGLGYEIGNHTMSHPDMSFLSLDDQSLQWNQATEALSSYGMEPQSACYPYGKMSADSTKALRAAGFQGGVALGKRPAKKGDDHLALPRIVVAYSDTVAKLLYKIYLRPVLP